MARECPDCQIPMLQDLFQGVTLDHCAQCAGVWFDEGELRSLQETDHQAMVHLEEKWVPKMEAAPSLPHERRCPNDGAVLEGFHYLYDTPVVLDRCETCYGVWVQNNELLKMQRFLDQQHLPEHEQIKAEVIADEAARERSIFGFLSVWRRSKPPWSGV